MIKDARYKQFSEDMEAEGYEVRPYRGRYSYEGPSIRVESEELQDAIRATDLSLQWDQMGRSGLVVYPK